MVMDLMSCVVIGNESLLMQCCEKLLALGHRIAAVVTRNRDIATWAQGRELVTLPPGAGLAARLPDAPFDWLLSIANLDILPADVLTRAVRSAVNFHDGPLPRHAGVNAPVWALIEGETRHGITWHMMEGGLDEGDILTQREFEITGTDTALTLNSKCLEAGINSFNALIDLLETGSPLRRTQDLSQRRLHRLTDRPAQGGCLDFTLPARELERLVRALDHGPYWNPLCTAKVLVGNSFWHVGAALVTEATGTPGTVTRVTGDSLTVVCGEFALTLSVLRMPEGQPADPSARSSPCRTGRACPSTFPCWSCSTPPRAAASPGPHRRGMGGHRQPHDGRAGMAIARGWQPDDFILRPENTPPHNKAAMIGGIDTAAQALARRGGGVSARGWQMHGVVTQPRPVSKANCRSG